MNLRNINLGALRAKHESEDASIDYAIRYYSLMEVAAIASYVPAKFPRAYRDRALPLLDAVERSKDAAGLVLPQLHRLRLRGEWTEADYGPDLPAIFIAFEQVMRILDEPDVHALFELLRTDDSQNTHLYAILDIVRTPEAFAGAFMLGTAETADEDSSELWTMLSDPAALRNPMALAAKLRQEPSEEPSPAVEAVHGLRKLMLLCRDLEKLLDSTNDHPLLRSAMWHCSVSPFAAIRRAVYDAVKEMIHAFESWMLPEDAPATEAETVELKRAIEVLGNIKHGLKLQFALRHCEKADRQPRSDRSRPIVHSEPWAKLTLILLDRHVEFLDRIAIDIRLKHGRAISRSEVIRALIESAFANKDRAAAAALEDFLTQFAGTSGKSESTQPAVKRLERRK